MASRPDLSWLPQYPHEEEVTFKPLTALEVARSRVEGSVVVVSLRVRTHDAREEAAIYQASARGMHAHVQAGRQARGIPPPSRALTSLRGGAEGAGE